MSKSLIKLIDYSLLPAALLVVGKFMVLYLTINIFSLDWGIKTIPNSLFSVRPIFYSEDVIIASTYSDVIMFLFIVTGFSFVLIQALVFHNSHVSPKILAKLASHNLLGLIKNTFEIYHKAAIWTLFVWISNFLILINVLTGKTGSWVLIFSLACTILLTVFLIRDTTNEIEISKKMSKNKILAE